MPNGDGYFISRAEFNRMKETIDERITKNEVNIAKLNTACDSLKDIPEKTSKVELTLALLGQRMEQQNEMISGFINDFHSYAAEHEEKEKKQDKKIQNIDNKSKVDLMDWVRLHWTEIITTVSVVTLIAKDYLK